MKYSLIAEMSKGEFDATHELQNDYDSGKYNDWDSSYKNYRAKASRTWEVYKEYNHDLWFTVTLQEQESYCPTNKLLSNLLINFPKKNSKKDQREQSLLIWEFVYATQSVFCGLVYKYWNESDIYIALSRSKREFVASLYEHLKSNAYLPFPDGLVDEIDGHAYTRTYTLTEYIIYRNVDTFIKNAEYENAIRYVITLEPRRCNDMCYDIPYYLGDKLYKSGDIEAAFKAFNLEVGSLFEVASMRYRIQCSINMLAKQNLQEEDIIKWRAIFLCNCIEYAADNYPPLVTKNDILNKIFVHFGRPQIIQNIIQSLTEEEATLDSSSSMLMGSVLESLLMIIDKQNQKIAELSHVDQNFMPAYTWRIIESKAERDKLIRERNLSDSNRREFDKRFGLTLT